MKCTNLYPALAVLLAIALAGCSDTSNSGKKKSTTDVTPILTDYANNAVIADYAALATAAASLNTAIGTLAATSNATNVDAARTAWLNARVAWESCEGMLFGPVEDDGIDPHIDTWPVDQSELDAAIALNPSNLDSSAETVIGFHTIEYLLWSTHQDSTTVAAGLSANDKDYLVLLGQDLEDHTADLLSAWQSTGGNYIHTLVTAGQGSSTYVSQSAAMQQLVQGMADIADEVGQSKIATPFSDEDPNEVESQFSYNSFIDFHNNINGINIAYNGSYATPGTAGTNSMSSLVATLNPTLDSTIHSQITAALTAIDAVDNTLFHTDITDATNATKIEAAQDALLTLHGTLTGSLMDLMQSTNFKF